MSKYLIGNQLVSETIRCLNYLMRLNYNLDEDTLLQISYSLPKGASKELIKKENLCTHTVNAHNLFFFQNVNENRINQTNQSIMNKSVYGRTRYSIIERTWRDFYNIFWTYNLLLQKKPMNHLRDWAYSKKGKNSLSQKSKKKSIKTYEIIKYIVKYPCDPSDLIAEKISKEWRKNKIKSERGSSDWRTDDAKDKYSIQWGTSVTSHTIRATFFRTIRYLETVDDKSIKIWGLLLATISFGKVHWKYLPKLLDVLKSTKEEYYRNKRAGINLDSHNVF